MALKKLIDLVKELEITETSSLIMDILSQGLKNSNFSVRKCSGEVVFYFYLNCINNEKRDIFFDTILDNLKDIQSSSNSLIKF